MSSKINTKLQQEMCFEGQVLQCYVCLKTIAENVLINMSGKPQNVNTLPIKLNKFDFFFHILSILQGNTVWRR